MPAMPGAWFTAAELAGLPGMPTSEFRTRARLDREQVPSRLRGGSKGGGGREFDAAHLPAETRAALLLQSIETTPAMRPSEPEALPAAAPAAQTLPATPGARTPPSRQDAACADARAVVLRHLDALAAQLGGVTRAAEQLVEHVRSGQASAELSAAVQSANQRSGSQRRLSVRTLHGWRAAQAASGWWGLLPQPSKPASVAQLAPDVAAVLRAYASTSGAARNLTHVAQRVNLELGHAFDEWRSLYERARRALPKLDKVKLIKARHTGAQRAAQLPFKRRDTGNLKPNDVWVTDGHTFKAKVRHPEHGAPFAPEVTLAIDVATRKIVGWSAALSENTIAVGDCIRHAVGQHGVPAMVYSDRGAGETAKAMDCEVVGLFARLGTEHRVGLPGHPQGHGLIERSWQTHMIRCARQFATYQGGDVDDRTLRQVSAELAKEQRALKRAEAEPGTVVRLSSKCPSWQQFLDAVGAAVLAYNTAHRHRGLPRHAGGELQGRHMTPDEAWAEMLAPADQVLLDPAALRHVFMPAVLRTAVRGEVRFLNQHYFSAELMQVDGEQVRVHYDIHSAASVWVWTLDGRFVCEAQWGANRMDYFPLPAIEVAKQKRVLGMVKRREAQIETARAELRPTLPAPSAAMELQPFEVPAQPQPLAVIAGGGERPFFGSASERYEWLMQHPDRWADGDANWLATYAASSDYEQLAEYFTGRGIAWPDDPPAFNHAG